MFNLRLAGYEVCRVADGESALRAATGRAPAAVVVAVDLPDTDRVGVVARLRQNPATCHAPVLVTADRGLRAERLQGLAAGADDYLLWPFSAHELHTRLATAVNRARELRETSPLTGLPGNRRVLAELRSRVGGDEPIGVVHADVTDFKPFNDRYGFARGDGVIVLAAEVLCEAAVGCGDDRAFVGHIGGDDLMVITTVDAVVPLCTHAVAAFDARVPTLCDADDTAGVLEVADRRGARRRFPLVSIALGVVTTRQRRFNDPRELLTVAAEMKNLVKRQHRGSQYAIDARGASGERWRQGRSAATRARTAAARPPATPHPTTA